MFLHKYHRFLPFVTCYSFVKNFILFFLVLIILFSYFFLRIHRNFFYNLHLCIHHAHFLSLNDNIVDIEKLDGIYFPTLVVDNFSGLFLHPSTFFIKDSRSE